MDNYGADNNGELNRLVSELTQGRDLVQQLQLHLNAPNYNNSSASPETAREFLLHNIQSKFDTALSLLQYNSTIGDNSNSLLAHSNSPALPIFGRSESPPSFTTSPPHSEDSDRDLEPKDPTTRNRKSSTPRWTKQVQIHPGAPIEGSLDDGFSWRKYGQKDILGAKHPRGYYRCTLRHVQGCLATKQVQRSDEDPNIFEVTYRGRHTCNQGAGPSVNNVNPAPAPLAVIIPQNQEPNLGNHELHQNPQEILLNFQKNLSISTDDFNFNTHHDPNDAPYIPSFNNFPSSSSHVNTDHQNYSYVPNSSIIPNNNFVESFPPSLNMSAGTSQMNSFGGKQNDADCQFNSMGYESNFPYDYQGFSS
ncbi:probable WRKY transcription factor 41 [Lycium barbarum]|uniref:probable WRKY transcription factor 41 n=1 Tax=Lycium barbarum TaxID=112863 RepID=UPI00293F5F83|nr:probable WRKY transcription factor 41 [Lycium barbarum]